MNVLRIVFGILIFGFAGLGMLVALSAVGFVKSAELGRAYMREVHKRSGARAWKSDGRACHVCGETARTCPVCGWSETKAMLLPALPKLEIASPPPPTPLGQRLVLWTAIDGCTIVDLDGHIDACLPLSDDERQTRIAKIQIERMGRGEDPVDAFEHARREADASSRLAGLDVGATRVPLVARRMHVGRLLGDRVVCDCGKEKTS